VGASQLRHAPTDLVVGVRQNDLHGFDTMPRILFVLGIAFALFAAGCGGGGQKGKNQDFDRPKLPETK
jgi:hypothetical protein